MGTKAKLGAELPDAPLMVFINSRSGGRAGARLTQVLCHVIGHVQASSLLCPDPHRVAFPLLPLSGSRATMQTGVVSQQQLTIAPSKFNTLMTGEFGAMLLDGMP